MVLFSFAHYLLLTGLEICLEWDKVFRYSFFGRPFVKRFALCCRSVVFLSVCLFVTFVHCGQTVKRIKMKLGMQVGLGPGHIVLDGDPAPPPQRGTAPAQFLAHICCGQMAAWIKMPLGMELGLSPRDFVLDGNPAPPPNFRLMFIIASVISLEHSTMHSRYWFIQVRVLVFYAFYF